MTNTPCSHWMIIISILLAGCAAPREVPAIQTLSPTDIQATAPATMTAEATAIPTETRVPPTATATGMPSAQDVWQVSPDNHIVYNEAQLYGGLFTVDTQHPEYAQKYWEDTIRGLWNLNSVGKNIAFLSQFLTADSLVEWINDERGPVNNLWIPVIYPNSDRRFFYQATLVPADGPVDLSHIAIGIEERTSEEMHNYNPRYGSGMRFISYFGSGEQVLVENMSIDGMNILKFIFRSEIPKDWNANTNTGEILCLALSEDKTDAENLLAATQLIRSWPLRMQIKDNENGHAWIANVDPPLLNINSVRPTPEQYESITTINGTPIAIR